MRPQEKGTRSFHSFLLLNFPSDYHLIQSIKIESMHRYITEHNVVSLPNCPMSHAFLPL